MVVRDGREMEVDLVIMVTDDDTVYYAGERLDGLDMDEVIAWARESRIGNTLHVTYYLGDRIVKDEVVL